MKLPRAWFNLPPHLPWCWDVLVCGQALVAAPGTQALSNNITGALPLAKARQNLYSFIFGPLLDAERFLTPSGAGTISAPSPLLFLGETEQGLGLADCFQGQFCGSAPCSAQGKDAEKCLPTLSQHCPTRCESCLAWWLSLHTSREMDTMLPWLLFLFAFIPITANTHVLYNRASDFTRIPYVSVWIFFSLRGVKEILNKMVFVNWAEVGGGRLIILAVLASDQREMLFIRAQDIIQPKWQALLWRNPGLSWLRESITAYSQGGGGRGARRSAGGCQQGRGKFTLCQPAWHSTSFVDKCKSAGSFSQALKRTVSPSPSLPPLPKTGKEIRTVLESYLIFQSILFHKSHLR